MGAEHDAARNRLSLPGLTFSARSRDGYTIVTTSGDLDIACVPALREQLLGLLKPHANRIVVDLSRVTFCDASGLAVLIGARRRAWLLGGVLRLAAPALPVTTVLRLTGLDMHFEIFATVLAATSVPARLPVPDASPHRQAPGTLPPDPGRTCRWTAAADDGVHEAVTALLAHADAWRDADPDRRLTRPLGALARAHADDNRADLMEAARSLLAGLLRYPLTHSPAVAATATGLRRRLPSGRSGPLSTNGPAERASRKATRTNGSGARPGTAGLR
jgi:anti-anti-sigma factor